MIRSAALTLVTIALATPMLAGEEPYAADDPRVEPPVRISGETPGFPPPALEHCYEGTVELEALVAADGTVSKVAIVEDEHFGLGRAAAAAVFTWTYQPARLRTTGATVSARTPVTVEFTSPCPGQDRLNSQPLRVGGDVSAPKKISSPAPQYTQAAREACVQGVVILEALVNKLGVVESVRILKDLPGGLGAAATKAVREWSFEPATSHDGQPVDVLYTLTVTFEDSRCGDPPKVFRLQAISTPTPAVGNLRGTVTAELTISKKGRVTRVKITEASDPRLIEPVKETLRSWRYEPPRDLRTGKKVRARRSVALKFPTTPD